MNHRGKKKILARAIIALALLVAGSGYASNFTEQSQTVRRWNPLRVPATARFAGDQACAECHRSIAASLPENSMWRAMEFGKDSPILKAHPALKFRAGPYVWEIIRKGDQSLYAVTDGSETISVPIHFVFGQGKAGQTYVLQYDGAFYESRVSFFNDIEGLDFTIGSPRTAPKSLKEAFGRKIPADEALRCFGCHSTAAIRGGQLHAENLTPGVRCESCHGPGGEHVAAIITGQPRAAAIFNPGRLGGDELTQVFCAACHGNADDVTTLKNAGDLINVRFQPYRIFNSKCYSNDKRISCTACHNVHEALRQDAAYYDEKCLACHQSNRNPAANAREKPTAPRCRTGLKNCAECHMPKVEPPGAHFKFTDHFIRIAKPNEAHRNRRESSGAPKVKEKL